MHLEDRLAMVRSCLEEGGSILFRSITSNRNPADNSLLKTCFYHMKSLNESMQQGKSLARPRSENEPCELPKLHKAKQRQAPPTSSSPKTSLLLSKLAERVEARPDASSSGLLKLSSSILLRNTPTPPENPKQREAKVRRRPHFKNLHSRPAALGKQQRFFEDEAVQVCASRVQALGCYQAGNIYKAKNLGGELREMRVVASRPEFAAIKLANKHDLFLTTVPAHPIDFCVEEFIEQELNKEKDCERVIRQCDSIRVSRDLSKEELTAPDCAPAPQQSDLYVTIKDFAFVRDESFRLFRAREIENWGDVLLAFENVLRCMRLQKISFLKVKAEKLARWGGRKSSLAEVTRALGLQALGGTAQRIETVCLGFLDRLRVRRLREKLRRREWLARWVCTRLKTFTLLRRLRRERREKAVRLHRELRREMQWDTEIHLPSFSVDEFQRNTTQYLESLENVYHAMWRNSSKHLVLVLPTLNEAVLRALQTRLRVTRSLTIICPELHEAFPRNLSLAAQVLFSYETLKRIERAIDGRVAVLVPGCDRSHSRMEHEMLLSEHLNVPLLCSLEAANDGPAQKAFFARTGTNAQPHCFIPPGSTQQQLLANFCDLLAAFPEDRRWIIKLEGEFKGRGIATIRLNPAKCFRHEGPPEESRRALLEHLKANFKLKLKINFENSLYMVEDFLKRLQATGGVIEEEVEAAATYELCFYKHHLCEFQYLYRLYGTDYSNKIWLSQEAGPELQALVTAMQDRIEEDNYLGHLTATVCRAANGKFYGIDLKLHQTYSSSMVSFISMIEEKRGLGQAEAANIHHLPTQRVPPSPLPPAHAPLELALQNYSYLIIPNLVFTDIEEEVKARLIEEMMAECWGDRHVKLHEECRLLLSVGVDFGMVFIGRDVKRLKKRAIDSVRELNDRTSSYRKYRGKEVIRDVFQYGDIIRALTQIKE